MSFLTESKISKILRGIYKGDINPKNMPKDVYQATAKHLVSGAYEGFGFDLKTAKGSKLKQLLDLRENLYLFSGAKTYQQTVDMGAMLKKDDGVYKTFKQFKDDVMPVYEQYNVNWLKAEYETAIGQSRMAAQWDYIEGTKDILPYLEFSTDGRPCPECAPFEGLKRPVDDPIWSIATPLLHFNCFTGDTPILTPNGWVRIDSISKGDIVIGGSGNKQNVIGIHSKAINEKVTQINVKNNSTTSTEDHRFLTTKGWTFAKNILAGDIVIQNIEVGFFNKIICTINNLIVIIAHLLVAVKRQWKARVIDAFDTEIQRRDINIGKPTIDNRVTQRRKPLAFDKVKNNLFTFGKLCVIYSITFGIFIKHFFYFFMSPFINFFIKHRVIFGHKFRSIGAFSSEQWMGVVRFPFIQGFTRLFFPNVISYPLLCNTFGSTSDRDVKLIKQLRNGSIANTPLSGNIGNSHIISDVQSKEGFTDGQPLNSFNSLFGFLKHSFFNRKFKLVINTRTFDYTGQIYNISVEFDESYITNVGVVHNCFCVLRQSDEETGMSSDKFVKDLPIDTIPELFHQNVGKTGEIFTKDHPYFNGVPKKLASKNFGLSIPEKD